MKPKEVKTDWELLSINDVAGWRGFFDRYCCLSVYDIATLAGVSIRTVRKRKQTATGREPGVFNFSYVAPHRALPVPPNWDNRDWLLQAYERHGVRTIAKAVHRSLRCIQLKLRHYKIPTKTNRQLSQLNPCNSRDWLLEHYYGKDLSLTRCAELARVSRDTLVGWLVRHKISLKHARSSAVGQVTSL